MERTYDFKGSDVKVPGNGDYSRIIQLVLDAFDGTIGTPTAMGTEDRAASGAAADGPSLYLLENKGDKVEGSRGWWTGKEIRSKDMCKRTIENAVERLGRYGVVVVTLTDGGSVPDERVACDKWKNLWQGYFKRRSYVGFAKVVERGEKSGKVHIHAVLGCPEGKKIGYHDVRGQFHPSKWCREEREDFSAVCEGYGFGKIEEFDVVKKTGKAVGCYFAKYITKGFENRRLKGARVWSCSRNWSIGAVSRTGSGTVSGWYWRQKIRAFLKGRGIQDEEQAVRLWGPSWQWKMSQTIKSERVLTDIKFPSERHAKRAKAVLPMYETDNGRWRYGWRDQSGVSELSFPCNGHTQDFYDQLLDDAREEFEREVRRRKKSVEPALFDLENSSPDVFACTGAEVP